MSKEQFFRAVEARDIATATQILTEVAEAAQWVNENNQQDGFGDCRPLYLAAEKGDRAMAELLLKHGADINEGGGADYSLTPLLVAIKHGHSPMMELLLAKGADVNKTDQVGVTALKMVTMHSPAPAIDIKLLLNYKINTDELTQGRLGDYSILGESFGLRKNVGRPPNVAASALLISLVLGSVPENDPRKAQADKYKPVFEQIAERGLASLSVKELKELAEVGAAVRKNSLPDLRIQPVEAFSAWFGRGGYIDAAVRAITRRELNQKAVEKVALGNAPIPGDAKRHIASYIGADDLPAKWRGLVRGGEQQSQAVAGRTL